MDLKLAIIVVLGEHKMTKEQLEVYDLQNNFLGVQDRNQFYSEIREEFAQTGKITRQIKAIRLLLMNSQGRIYLQKRSKYKNENPGVYDKTVGGHVSAGQTYVTTVVKECAEELGFPTTILSKEEFDQAITNTDIGIIGIFKKVDHISNFKSIRIKKEGDKFVQPYMTSIYIGYYDGAIRFVDGESSGIEVFSLEELKEDIKNNPEKFTEDIKFMINKYEKYLVPIEK